MSRKYLYVDKSSKDSFAGGVDIGLTPLQSQSTQFWVVPFHTEPNKNRRKDQIDTCLIVHFEHGCFEVIEDSNISKARQASSKQDPGSSRWFYLVGKPSMQKVVAKTEPCPMNLNDKFKLFTANESDSMDAWFLSEAKHFIQNYIDYKSNNSDFDLTLELNFRSVIQDLKDYWYDSVQSRYTHEQSKGRFTHIPNVGNQNDIRELKLFDIIMDYLQFVQDSVIEHLPQGGNEVGHPIMVKKSFQKYEEREGFLELIINDLLTFLFAASDNNRINQFRIFQKCSSLIGFLSYENIKAEQFFINYFSSASDLL